MKKIYFAFLCAACAFTLFSCQKENNGPEESPVPDGYVRMTLKAVSDETKTTVDGEGNVKWAEGDQIKVYFNKPEAVDFTLVGNGGSAYGDFTGDAPGGYTALYAVYPTARYSSVSSSTVYVTIPATQAAVFGQANIAVAKVDGETGHMAFKNVNAFVGFTVPEGANKVVVSSVGGENLSGTLAVDCSGDVPAVDALSSGGSSITVNFPNAEGGTYYVAVAPGVTHSKGLLLTWKNGDTVTGTYWLNKAVTTVSGEIIEMETVSTDGKYYVTVDGAGKKNGMSWEHAWSASQFWSKIHPAGSDTAIDNAKLANINGATFHFAEGTYNWGADAAISIDDVSFKVEGGYNASTGERDIKNNKTIFTGDDDADGIGDHRILFINGDLNITFDGITFTKGVTFGSDDARFGGGVFIRRGSHSFIDCAFNDNSAQYGGAIRFESEEGELTLTRTSFSNNTASSDAGALSLAAGNIQIENSTFDNNSGKIGGAIDCSKGTSSTVVTIIGGEFTNNTASTNGGAIAVETDSYLNVNPSGSFTTSFTSNSTSGKGGALYIESSNKSQENIINNAVFKGNHAYNGGAVAVYYISSKSSSTTKVKIDRCSFGGTDSGEPNNSSNHGGTIYAESDTYVNVGNSTFTGNYSSNQNGGAFCIRGDAYIDLKRDTFIGNYGKSGGVGFAQEIDSKYPRLFVDECSFDANYITTNYGCVFNLAGIDNFCMHNSSVRGSYVSKSVSGEAACWIDLDGVQGVASISNCSIIGTATGSALVWSCNGSWTNYFTNNIIVQNSSSEKSIHSDGASLDVNFTVYSASTSITTGSNNTSGKTDSNIDGLAWSNYDSSSYYWKWDGTIDGAAPSMTNKTDVNTRVNGICSAFVEWSDFGMDQRHVSRGNGDWWPGAYQPSN